MVDKKESSAMVGMGLVLSKASGLFPESARRGNLVNTQKRATRGKNARDRGKKPGNGEGAGIETRRSSILVRVPRKRDAILGNR